MHENEEKQKNVMKAWKCKADELKESNILLEKSFKQAINHEMDDVSSEMKQETSLLIQKTETQAVEAMQTIKDSSTQFADDAIQERIQALEGFETEYESLLSRLDKQAAEMNQAYQEGINKLDQTTNDIVEKQRRNNHIFENGKFVFSNLIMVVIAVVLLRALFFGVWEVLYVNTLYAWGIQWDWLKYTMWGLFAIIIGATVYYVYLFLKNNLNRPGN